MALKGSSRILLVDDDDYSLRMMKEMLSRLGLKNITTSKDVPSAMKVFSDCEEKGEEFDLILSDYNMPGLTGVELYEGVQTKRVVPFIIITAESDKDSVLKIMEAGIKHIVLKPYTPNTLTKYINEVMN